MSILCRIDQFPEIRHELILVCIDTTLNACYDVIEAGQEVCCWFEVPIWRWCLQECDICERGKIRDPSMRFLRSWISNYHSAIARKAKLHWQDWQLHLHEEGRSWGSHMPAAHQPWRQLYMQMELVKLVIFHGAAHRRQSNIFNVSPSASTCGTWRSGAIPDGVAANIAAALLLTTAQGLLEMFRASTPPKRWGTALTECARIAAAQHPDNFILAGNTSAESTTRKTHSPNTAEQQPKLYSARPFVIFITLDYLYLVVVITGPRKATVKTYQSFYYRAGLMFPDLPVMAGQDAGTLC